MTESDRILKVLEETHRQSASELPFFLIQRAYEVQKNFLFEKDRNKPMEMLKQIAEDYAENEASK